MSGIIPNTLDSELNPPGRETTIVGNLVVDNNNYEAPANRLDWSLKEWALLCLGELVILLKKI